MKKLSLSLLTSLFLIHPFLPCLAQPGTLDSTFGVNGIATTVFDGQGINALPYSLALQPDGKIIAAGRLVATGQLTFAMVRHHPDGSLDDSFGTEGKAFTLIGYRSEALAAALQPDGKIVLGGYYGPNSGGAVIHIAVARYHPDGSLDNTFGTDGIVTTNIDDRSLVESLVIQQDGKIVVMGNSRLGPKDNITLVRYNENGSLDESFGIDGIAIPDIPGDNHPGFNSALAIQEDGKILVTGYNSTIDLETYQVLLFRLNADGSLDNTFNEDGIVTTFFGESSAAWALALQPDGRIVVGGCRIISFENPSPDEEFALVRYTPEGDLDPSFGIDGIVSTPVGNDSEIHALALQADGKILAGGNIGEEMSDSSDIWGLVRYRSDGSVDEGFGLNGVAPSDFVDLSDIKDIVIQPDGKILVTGRVGHTDENGNFYFTDFNIARYNSGLTVATTELNQEENPIFVYPNPVTGLLYITVNELNAGDLHFTLTDITGKILLSAPAHISDNKFSISCSNLTSGVYLINLFGDGGNLLGTEKIVVIREE